MAYFERPWRADNTYETRRAGGRLEQVLDGEGAARARRYGGGGYSSGGGLQQQAGKSISSMINT